MASDVVGEATVIKVILIRMNDEVYVHIIFSGSTSIVRLTDEEQIARNSLKSGNSTGTSGGNFSKICQR